MFNKQFFSDWLSNRAGFFFESGPCKCIYKQNQRTNEGSRSKLSLTVPFGRIENGLSCFVVQFQKKKKKKNHFQLPLHTHKAKAKDMIWTKTVLFLCRYVDCQRKSLWSFFFAKGKQFQQSIPSTEHYHTQFSQTVLLLLLLLPPPLLLRCFHSCCCCFCCCSCKQIRHTTVSSNILIK